MITKTYRTNGAIGALLDEYEKAIKELFEVLKTITDEQLVAIMDTETTDRYCRSVQTILTHVIRAGYYYADAIRHHKGEDLPTRPNFVSTKTEDYIDEIKKMFAHNVKLFDDYPSNKIEEYDDTKKIKARWGQSFDIEQMMEHAIVHVLRHRRQIERFKRRM